MTERASSWRDFDWLLLLLTLAIATLGVLEIYSATRATAWQDAHLRQMIWITLGLGAFWFASSVDYRWLVGQAPVFYVAAVTGLAAVLLFAPYVNGSRRWLPLPGLPDLQVSEFVKGALVLLVARFFSEPPRGGVTLPQLAKITGLFAIPVLLVIKQPDLSTGLSYLPILGMGIFLNGLRWRWVLSVGLLAVILSPIGWRVLTPYQKDRLTVFMEPEKDPRGRGYQSLQSKIAVGSGGLWGQGFARGAQTQLRFLPEAHTDFVLASFAEETGFVGILVAMTLYFAVLMKIVHNAQTAVDAAGAQLCMGVAALLLFHITVNVGMVVNRMPVTGLPLPLMSYGGSGLLSTFALLGLVNNVRMRRFAN
ncbi:MAG: rod shape-determining protein RodA [Acidobacteria bacterium]|nr:rod shape-determining protein RodA [Acidobacteriota bacterium]